MSTDIMYSVIHLQLNIATGKTRPHWLTYNLQKIHVILVSS